jgi:hypothetical protein
VAGNSSEIRAGKAFVEIGGKDKLSPLLDKISKKAKAVGESIRNFGVGIGAIGAAAMAPLAAGLHTFVDAGHDLDLMSKRTGIAVEALSELTALMSPEKLEAFEMGLKHMQKAITEAAGGSKEANEHLARLGITLGQLKGLTPDQQLAVFADAVARIPDPTERAGLSLLIFGKAGTAMLPMLLKGSQGMAEMRAEAKRLGLTISTDAVARATELHHVWRELAMVTKNLAFWIGSAVAPVVTDFAKRQVQVIMATRDWVKAHGPLIGQMAILAAKVFAVGTGIALLGTGIIVAAKAIGFLAPAAGMLLKALNIKAVVGGGVGIIQSLAAASLSLLNPWTLIGAVIVASGAALIYYSGLGAAAVEFLKGKWDDLSGTVIDTIGGISDALATGNLALAAQIGMLGVKIAFLQGTKEIREVWNGTLASIAKGAVIGFGWIQKAWADVTTWFYSNMPAFAEFMATFWANLTAGIKSIWGSTVDWVAKRMIDIQEITGALTPEEAAGAKAQIDKDHEAQQRTIHDQADKDIEDAKHKASMTPAELAAERDARLAAIDAETGARLKGIDDATDAQTDADKKHLDDLMAQLKALREGAALARREGGMGPPVPVEGLDVPGIADEVQRKLSGLLQFGGEGTGGLAAGGSAVFDRTAKATEDTAKYTKQIASAANNGLAFL